MAYVVRPSIKKRAQSGVMQAANIDTTGLDPEMKETLGNEAARRVGAAGVQVRMRNPLQALMGLFKKKPRK